MILSQTKTSNFLDQEPGLIQVSVLGREFTITFLESHVSLGSTACKDILTRHRQDTARREVYRAVLAPRGLAYQQKSQALLLGILNTAVIRIPEAQALFSFSAENILLRISPYGLEIGICNSQWPHPEGFEGLYTGQVCKKLYDAGIFVIQKQYIDNANSLYSQLCRNAHESKQTQPQPRGIVLLKLKS